jgi:hypothetical protein
LDSEKVNATEPFVVPLVKGMQEQQEMIEELQKAHMDQLKLNEAMRSEIESLKQRL